MTLRTVIAAFLACIAIPVHACEDEWVRLLNVLEIEEINHAAATRANEHGCQITDVALAVDRAVLRVDSIRWLVPGLSLAFDGRAVPRMVEFEIENGRYIPSIDDPVMDYLFDVQSKRAGIDAFFRAYWDEPNDTIWLENLRANFPGENSVLVSAEIGNVDLRTPETAAQSLSQFGLKNLKLGIESKGLFETYFIFTLGQALLDGSTDPEADIAHMIAQSLAIIQTLPNATFDHETRANLARLVTDMPNPYGTIQLELNAIDGLGPSPFIDLWENEPHTSSNDIWSILSGTEIDIRYDQEAAN